MVNMKRTAFVFLFLAFLLASCAPIRDRRTLSEVEALMPERPDSALVVLRALQPRDLPGLHVRPLHALLLSEALDKNYIDLTDDSLALAANRYYGGHGSKLHRVKSWYYLGRIRFNAGNYAEAVICYNKALEYAESLENYHYIGLINREIANAYSENWDSHHAIEHTKKAIEAFSVANEKSYILYCELALARLYRIQKDYSNSLESVSRIINGTDDKYLLASAHELETLISLSGPDYDTEQLSKSMSSAMIGSLLPENTSRLCNLAVACQVLGKEDSADYYLNHASQRLLSERDSITLVYSKYRIEALRNNYETACAYLEQYLDFQDPVLYRLLEQSISFYQGHYYQEESRMNALKAQMRAVYFLLLTALLIAIVYSLYSKNKQQREKIMEEIANTAEIRQDLLSMQQEKREIGQAVAALFESHMDTLQTLSDQYEALDDAYHSVKGGPSREEIVDSFRNMMLDLRRDKKLNISIEEVLNAWKDDIMKKFRLAFGDNSHGKSRITEEDIELVPYFFSGMKSKVISYITGHSEHAVRERKRRIRRKIEALDDSFSVEKRLFLDNL